MDTSCLVQLPDFDATTHTYVGHVRTIQETAHFSVSYLLTGVRIRLQEPRNVTTGSHTAVRPSDTR